MAFEYSWAEMGRNKKQANALSSAAAVGGRLRRIVRAHHRFLPSVGRPPPTTTTYGAALDSSCPHGLIGFTFFRLTPRALALACLARARSVAKALRWLSNAGDWTSSLWSFCWALTSLRLALDQSLKSSPGVMSLPAIGRSERSRGFNRLSFTNEYVDHAPNGLGKRAAEGGSAWPPG